ncbi:MAG TPA: NAD(P)-binding domain-containing protein [Rhizomicrobium sp.]|jgi:thioredoxin reductase|nr:NAD(P)-binding domain-containing protein [Rhizomicrobium sp.]
MKTVDVAIVGAGPYGLSLAAHLRHAGVSFRIFGKPLQTWREHMPKGMCLKSDGFASNLSAPDSYSTLEAWCALNGKAYSAQKIPVKLEDFVAYADWFQRTYVPNLEKLNVANIAKDAEGYTLTLENGVVARARRVVMAVGINWFKQSPLELARLPASHVSHAYDHHDMDRFRGKEVVVLGGGASAIDTALALHDAGAKVRVIARRKGLAFHVGPDSADPTILNQLQNPDTGIGPGWRSFFCVNAPLLFHKLPQKLRHEATRRHLGPAAGWFTREKFESNVATILGHHLAAAHIVDGRVALEIRDEQGRMRIVMADHVVAATGYKTDLARLAFLGADIRKDIAEADGTPVLSDSFECSVRGLYFVGLAAANAFGPVLRFMVGAEFAAPRLAAHLRRKSAATVTKKAA